MTWPTRTSCCTPHSTPLTHPAQVEGDELTGACLLGAQTDSSLLHQLVVPHGVLLASSVIFFLSGFLGSLFNPSEASRQLMVRLSLFFLLYTLAQVGTTTIKHSP